MSYWDLLKDDLKDMIIYKSNILNHEDDFKNVLLDVIKNPLNINVFSGRNVYSLLYNPKKMYHSPCGFKILHRYLNSYEQDLNYTSYISDVESSDSSYSSDTSDSYDSG